MKKTYYFSISYTFLDGMASSLLSYRKERISKGSRGRGLCREFEGGSKEGEAQ
jgi:hypothetical protein